ncbi:N-acetyl sugar amidotransferase [Candidatus Giovannonibacteria bacterium]|nr:N-acetyl sugar amidotransferase [Candidatus Giovannonibacteria bacterium]
MRYCSRCVYPEIAVNLNMDEDGICSSCRAFERAKSFGDDEWKRRKEVFEKTINEILKSNESSYDCIIPVSGGKDSYYQTHVMISEYGLKPLLVTYDGNNYLPEGNYNRDRMRQVFNADHLVFGPSVEVLKKLNRLCFRKMGDMNWHNHCGIMTYPIQIAVKFKIPLMIWGETNWDISGMYDPDDFLEFSARVRHEHDLRGFEWHDMLNDPREKILEKDLLWSKYPSDEEILQVGIRGLYIGNFFKWDPNQHTRMVQEKYGWKPKQEPFERTYRRFSNLDDRYENGVHDLLKFIKFGYGRGSDHASKDIRDGYMTREEGIAMVKKYDHVVSSDLYYWLEYVGMTEDEFWRIADTFRDPHVWRIEKGEWIKDNVWGGSSAFGPVHLSAEQMGEFKKKCSKLNA